MSETNNIMLDLAKLTLSDDRNCPFTWGIKNKMLATSGTAIKNRDLDEYKFADIPLMSFLVSIVNAFESMEKDNDEDAAEKAMKEAKSTLADICKDRDTADITRALEHVYQSTAMYIFHENDKANELKDLQKRLVAVSDLNEKEAAALTGCKGFALSLYHLLFVDEAIDLATEAIKGNEENALWHFVLGHCIRKKRRNTGIHWGPPPSPLEMSSFRSAAKYSPKAYYKIYSIQANQEANVKLRWYERDSFDRSQIAMYEEVWNMCGDSPIILLKIVLGMMRSYRACNFLTVHSILDRVDKLSKDNSTSLHYRGRAYKLQEDYKKAFEYLQRAGDPFNFPADCEYLSCMLKAGKSHAEIINRLMDMRSKYMNDLPERQQDIRLDLGIMYYELCNYENAAKYILEAIEIQPASAELKERRKFSSTKMKDTYSFVSDELLPKCDGEMETTRKLKRFITRNIG